MCNKDNKKLTAFDVMQAFVDDKNVEKLVKKTPFFAFPLLAAFIEFLGRTLDDHDWNCQYRKEELKPFDNAINTFQPFKQYHEYENFRKSLKDSLKFSLRDTLRNGMVHSFHPKSDLKLADKDDLNNNTIGSIDLFLAIKKTVKEIQNGIYNDKITNKINTPYINANNNISGSTETQN